jgi:hypothetical protein
MTYDLIQFEGLASASGGHRIDAVVAHARRLAEELHPLPNAEMVAWAMFEYR